MERSYIHELNLAYDEFFADQRRPTPVLTINSNELNFVVQAEHLRWIENRIRQALKLSPFQPELPLTL